MFLYVLGFSRWKFIELTLDRKQDTLFQCLTNTFLASEGVPQEIWFDNMRTVVDQSRTQFRKVSWNQRFYEYSKDAGFKPISCRPYRPQAKGKVEALARTVERLKVYNGEFDILDDLIDLVFELNEELNKDISQAIDCPPILRFNALIPFRFQAVNDISSYARYLKNHLLSSRRISILCLFAISAR